MTRRALAALAVCFAALAGCTERGAAPLHPEAAPRALLSGSPTLAGVLKFAAVPDLGGVRHAEKRIIASEGGTVELNGFKVIIPAGALPADTTVTIDLPTDLPLGKRLVAEFGPHDIQFNTPVTLVFPLSGVVLNGDPVEVARWENGAWTSLGGTVTSGGAELHGQTPHFSVYAGKYVMAGG